MYQMECSLSYKNEHEKSAKNCIIHTHAHTPIRIYIGRKWVLNIFFALKFKLMRMLDKRHATHSHTKSQIGRKKTKKHTQRSQ